MSNFKFTADATPQTSVEVALEPTQHRAAKTQTDAERIASAKARNLELVKANNLPGAQYGLDYLPEYFQDCSGPETSTYDFEHLFFILGFLQDPKFLYLSHNHRDGIYNSRTGIWTRGDVQISIQTLKDAVQNRIRELGISEVLLLEYLAVPHAHVESQAFNRLPFTEQMKQFRIETI